MIRQIDGREEMAPGETGTVKALFLAPGTLGVPVDEGAEFELQEGLRVVATGVIQKYL